MGWDSSCEAEGETVDSQVVVWVTAETAGSCEDFVFEGKHLSGKERKVKRHEITIQVHIILS